MSDPVLAAPPRHQTRLSPLKLLRTIKDSSIASFAEPAFKEEVVERRFLWRRHVIVNSPEAVKRIDESEKAHGLSNGHCEARPSQEGWSA